MAKNSIGAGLVGALILLASTTIVTVTSRADDADKVQQLLQARCVKQGQLGKSKEELTSNCGCLAQVGAQHLRPEWRDAILNGTSQQGLGQPMDDQAKFEADALKTCPAIAPYAPKPAG